MSEWVCRNLLGFFHLWFVFLVLGLFFFSQNVCKQRIPLVAVDDSVVSLPLPDFPVVFLIYSVVWTWQHYIFVMEGVWPSPVTLLFHLGPFGVLYIPPSFGSTREPGQCRAWKGHHQHTTNYLQKDGKTILGMCQLEFVFVMMLYYGTIHKKAKSPCFTC